jgi:nucleoid-associated protein YgaU
MTVKPRSGISSPGTVLLFFVLILNLAGCAQQPPADPTPGAPVSVSEPPLLPVALRVGHPQSYTIAPGDNLWDISSRFLEQPWRWPEMWGRNPQIDGSTGLYPGDTIELDERNGEPQLRLASGERPTIKLSPRVRVEEISNPVPAIPRDAVAPFIQDSMVVTRGEWESAPYVLGNSEGNLVTLPGSQIYARGIFDAARYQIFRPGEQYHDPLSGEALGFDMRYIGEAALEEENDPAVLRLISVNRELRPGDRLFPLEEKTPELVFEPQEVQ